jgi:oligoribonuclease NrnB/cAMP/cGMP phosphodiesterase (DHH superfamily)
MDPKLLQVIIFHYPCQDGLASCWIAHNYLNNINSEHELIPIQNQSYDNEFLNNLYEKIKDKYVGIFDFSFNLEITEKIKSLSKGLIILDHHITNQETLKDLDYAYFDMNLSGTGLSWNYFHPTEEMPVFLQMIQDRDLWTWKLPLSKDFCDGFHFTTSLNSDFQDSFIYFDELYENPAKVNKYTEFGNLLRKKKDKTLYGIVKTNKKIYNYVFNDKEYKVQMANCDHEMASDLGSMFSKGDNCDFAVIWRYDHNTEKYWLSLRSCDKANVADIAKSFGGGGHKNAAGCNIDEHPSKVFSNKN